MEGLFPAAIRHIVAAIEPEILTEAFCTEARNPYMMVNVPMEVHIERQVIMEQVVKDIQLFDSTVTPISLNGLQRISVSDSHATVYIPEHRRGGRDIMSANGIIYKSRSGTMAHTPSSNYSGNLANAGMSLLNAMTPSMPTTDHDVVLVSPNNILVRNDVDSLDTAVLHCNLSVDSRLAHIKNATSIPFIELCILKTKQLAYTRLNIRMGMNKIHKGKELGVFSDAVREYRDARESYMELLKIYRTSLVLNDPIARREAIAIRMPRILR